MFLPLDTERLLLRKVEQTDAAFVLTALSNDELTKYMLIRYYTLNEVQEQMDYYANHYKNDTGYYWLMQNKITNESIGIIGINNISALHKKAEMGFWLLQMFNNKGYVTEAAKAVLHFCFNSLKLNRVEATVETQNPASIKVIEKIGFTHEGTFKEYETNNGVFIDLMMYGLLAKEYFATID